MYVEHLAEKTHEIHLEQITATKLTDLQDKKLNDMDVIFISLPNDKNVFIGKYIEFLKSISLFLNSNAKVVVYGENHLLPLICYGIEESEIFHYQTWISVRKTPEDNENYSIANETKGAVIFSKVKKPMHICKVRLPYTYCPACNKTTKDYGGKKHLYHEYGTLMSDVWKDFIVDDTDPLPQELLKRIKDMFSIEGNNNMLAVSLWNYNWEKHQKTDIDFPKLKENFRRNVNKKEDFLVPNNMLINGDCLEELSKLKSNSVDYIFVDPPYNLKKKYSGYKDDLEIKEYFSWCDEWLDECQRVLKPGRYLSILNLPLWCARHYAFLSQKMDLSSWLTWEALSRPVRNIMPANYTILTLKKNDVENSFVPNQDLDENLLPMADHYCRRNSCVNKREPKYKPLTDLWTDIHRLKHNNRRYDHPTQLPPKLMKRLISIYTNPGDIVLDCFNGVGTTTLSAAQLERRYVGIEKEEYYHNTTIERHNDIDLGLDPFRKNNISADNKTKNNEEKRNKTPKSHKGLSKRKVQLKIKDLSVKLGKIPTKQDALKNLDIPEDYYNNYFKNWSEVVSAAKTTGMSEVKKPVGEDSEDKQLEFKL